MIVLWKKLWAKKYEDKIEYKDKEKKPIIPRYPIFNLCISL